MSGMDRRELLRLMAAAPVPLSLLSPAQRERAARETARALDQGAYQARFFTPSEWRTVRQLADLIIPRDMRSGSASDAGVPEFVDFVMTEWPDHQVPVRGGLAWLDRECRARHGKAFADLAAAEQTALLDQIAYPARTRPEMAAGVAFFNRFRDLVCSGFYSSREGVKDLGYQGNTFVAEWTGCPAEVVGRVGRIGG